MSHENKFQCHGWNSLEGQMSLWKKVSFYIVFITGAVAFRWHILTVTWRVCCTVTLCQRLFWPWRGSSTQVTGHESTLLEDNWADVVQELGIKSIKESCRAGWIIDWLLFWLAGSPRVKCSDKQILYQYRNHIDQMKESEYLFLSPDLDGKSQELYPAV